MYKTTLTETILIEGGAFSLICAVALPTQGR